jgi:CxxC motif-containing protein
MGCHLSVRIRDGKVEEVGNAGCKRGLDYGVKEVISPVRDFFTTIRIKGGKVPMLSVRSREPVPKDKLMAYSLELSRLSVSAPVSIGEVIVKNIQGSDVDIVATKTVEKA